MAAKRTGKPKWDEFTQLKNPRADSKLKRLPEEIQRTMWELRWPTSADTPPKTQEEVLVWLLDEHNVSAHGSSFSLWEEYWRAKLEMESTREAIEQAVSDELARNPDATDAALDRVIARTLKVAAFRKKDAKSWAAVKRAEQEDKKIGQKDQEIGLKDKALKQKDEMIKILNRRVVLLEKKAAFADAVKKAAKGRKRGVTAAEMQEIERQLKIL